MSVKTQRLEQLKAKLKGQGHEFSQGLKLSLVTGESPTFPMDLGSTNIDQLTSHQKPIINTTRHTLQRRPLPTTKHIQKTMNVDSQLSLNGHDHEPDTTDIVEKLGPLLSQIQQQLTTHDSQLSSQERSIIFQELLGLSMDEVKVACDHIDFDVWTDSMLSGLCCAFDTMDNLAYPVACTVVQASIYPHILKSKTSTSRLLMNSILKLGTSFGNVLLNALILPLLGTGHTDQTQIGRPQLELILKLISGSLNVSSRTAFLRLLLSRWENAATNDTILQLMNTLATSTNPAISMDRTMIRQLIELCRLIVQAKPKDKTCMQLLLTLTSKHTQALVDADELDNLEAVANQSDMFLKRAVLGQLVTIRKKQNKIPPLT